MTINPKNRKTLKLFACLLSTTLAISMMLPQAVYAAPVDDLAADDELAIQQVADEELAIQEAADDDIVLPQVGDEAEADLPEALDQSTVDDPEEGAVDDEDDALVAPLEIEITLTVADADIAPLGLADDGWTQYTGTQNAQIVSFPIVGAENLTGYLGASRADSAYGSNMLAAASYYLYYADGGTTANITYAYQHNSFSTSAYYVVVYDGSSFTTHNIGAVPIDSMWTKEMSPGYTALLLQGSYQRNGVDLDVKVIMTPSANGTVKYEWQVTNMAEGGIDIAAAFMIDTELQGRDNVPVYAVGLNKGMYIDTDDAFARLYFPYVPESSGGPYDYAAGQWSNNYWGRITAVFGSNLDVIQNRDVPRELGDVLLQGVDSAVLFRYRVDTLEYGGVRGFVYLISLGETTYITFEPDVEPSPPPATVVEPAPVTVIPISAPASALPATGDSAPMTLAIVLALSILGALGIALSRRRQNVVE